MKRPIFGATLAVALVGAVLTIPATAAPAHTAAPDPGSCSVVDGTISVSASYNQHYMDLFADYGNNSGEWSGADSTYSVPLKDGSIAWIFSDTFYGPTNPDGSRPLDTAFTNQSMIIESGGQLVRTVVGGTADEPNGIVPPEGQYTWYWFGDGMLHPNGKTLYVGALQFSKFEPYGLWDWGWSGNYIAAIDTKTWKLKSLTPAPSQAGVQWASYYVNIDGTRYIYGVEDQGVSKYMHVAKLLGNDLTKTKNWRYWTGSGWSKNETDSVRIMDGVANEYSVEPFHDGYLLVTQNTHEIFSNQVLGYFSCSPTGPFVNPVELFRMQEVGLWGSYGNPNVFAYNAHAHPEFTNGDTLLITYNVNSFDNVGDVYNDVTIYRPRFMDVTITVTD